MRKFILLIFIFFIASCAIFLPREVAWEQEILKWQNFKLEGLMEVNYKSFSFRKNIVVEKHNQTGSFTIFETGLFGLAPQPLISASYQNKKLTVDNLPPELASHIPIKEIDMIFNLDQLVHKANYKNNKAFWNEYIIFFERGKLSSLRKKDKKIEFKYQGKQPIEIIFTDKNKEIGKIIIDKINFRRGR